MINHDAFGFLWGDFGLPLVSLLGALGIHLAPFGVPWAPFGSLWAPWAPMGSYGADGFLWVPLGSYWVPVWVPIGLL